MNIEKIFKIITKDKPRVFDVNDIGLPEFSAADLLALFRQAVEENHKNNYCAVQISTRHKINIRPLLIELMSTLDEVNLFSGLKKFPSSFRLTNVQLYHPEILELNKKLFKDYSEVFTANLYFTPDQQHNALSLHAAAKHIFVHQVSGDKAWTILENHENGEYDGIGFDNLSRISKKTELVLKKNQVLYLPFKVPHKAVATANGHSLHITYAFEAIPVKHNITLFMMQKLDKGLRLNQNKYKVNFGKETEVIDNILLYFEGEDEEQITEQYFSNNLKVKKNILENGFDYK